MGGKRNALPVGLGRVSSGARQRRGAMLRERFPELAEMNVLDIGGTLRSWMAGEVHPARLVILNVLPHVGAEPPSWVEYHVGDACDPPTDLGKYDLVFSNSVIEHVGGYHRRRRFAETVALHGSQHWVQTPHRMFPLEPHYMFPGAQWLPPAVTAKLSLRWPWGNRHPQEWGEALNAALSLELVSTAEMRLLFPDSEIVTERLAGLPKSLIAVR